MEGGSAGGVKWLGMLELSPSHPPSNVRIGLSLIKLIGEHYLRFEPLEVLDGRSFNLGEPGPLEKDVLVGDLAWDRLVSDHHYFLLR